jgi:hypothetical protein
VRNPEKSFALLATGLGFVYFAWLYSATGIFVSRGRAVTAAEDPERFSYLVGVAFIVGLASLVAGLITLLRR